MAGPRMSVTLVLSLAAVAAVSGGLAHGHTQPAAELPNPYRPVENHFKLAEGRWWGSTSAVDIDIDGRSIWVAERCAANSCAGSKLNPILKFDEAGRLRRRFGEGLFILPHGIHVDREGNVWVTDAEGPDGTDPDRDGKGHAVYKFSPTGRLLLTLGTPGVAGDGTGPLLNGPSDVVTAPNGDIFVADGAGGLDPDVSPPPAARVVRYAADGAFITAWGTVGSAPGEFRAPRGLALDLRGRLFVADRGNARIQIFDQEGRFLDAWTQFGRASGIYIDRDDRLYAADRESSVSFEGWGNGIRIGSALDGSLLYFIADSGAPPTDTRGLAGVAVDGQGNVFGASVDPEIPPRALMKYVKY
ncbi:MAG: peptidyl-alpha-hydroxyglycine alpha-amidating lyase family protein [Vicinamibacterales bacterium]|nr:peptidyl-alpha-hydroxyglycine alpha-amidating lyase family protein [Vicinamibacterales bacterium]MDP7479969.1 peptidyl-alpha-hydroxyglycine alpha-amidating lyase family protein [Vicinamibacterales bacterium]MDP7690498.1 peptidyl-alpha-hydroxyglycine alpha-amidating lyase family protein [Vicinamibacterales bacterium]HJN44735.1 peptidyl-alpha-hydroxyglycine alpha-amidating lyase family protein [Vicinamibacterales bacterium]